MQKALDKVCPRRSKNGKIQKREDPKREDPKKGRSKKGRSKKGKKKNMAWWTTDLHNMRRNVDHAFKEWKKHSQDPMKQSEKLKAYKELRQKYNKNIKSVKTSAWRTYITYAREQIGIDLITKKDFNHPSKITETVLSVESELKNEIKTKVKEEVKEEPFEVFEAREKIGIDLITKDDFNHPSKIMETVSNCLKNCKSK